MVKIVTISNIKGGVGKTTTATNFASGLARKGKKVLLIDLDPQANATSNLFNGLPVKTIKDLFQGTPVSETIYPSVETNLDIIPSCLAFSTMEIEIAPKMARETILTRAIKPIVNEYDVIILDTQPSIGVISLNALCAADEVLIPVYEAYAIDALTQLLNIITQVKSAFTLKISICGILLTMYDARTNLAKDVKNHLTNLFGDLMFTTTIPKNIRLAECPSHNKSIFEYAPESTGAVAYEAFTTEVMEKWGIA